ncbi:MAG: cytochrome c oxidase subunit II [Ktedonobacterales bacterium]|nr:cytochrome c oxidase subunit II [Ktedonobacterales bacterium]
MNEAPQQRRHILRATLIWIVTSVIGIIAAMLALPALAAAGMVPTVASDRAGEVDQVLFLFTLLSIPVFLLVVVYMGYSVFAFRSPSPPPSDGPALRGNLPLQISWVAISVALVAFLFGYGLVFLNKVNASPKGDVLQVRVTAEQWLWNYSYPQYAYAGGTTLELPVGRPVEFIITSIDVQHSFWIPALGVKQDAVPGQTTRITNVTPTKIGDYEVRCAELCGLYHAYMNTPLRVVTDDDFTNWITQQPMQQPSSTFRFGGPPAIALTGVVRYE